VLRLHRLVADPGVVLRLHRLVAPPRVVLRLHRLVAPPRVVLRLHRLVADPRVVLLLLRRGGVVAILAARRRPQSRGAKHDHPYCHAKKQPSKSRHLASLPCT
jgi:hypothetical protein